MPSGLIPAKSAATCDASQIHACLVRTEGGTPFVSSLELRPLTDDVYAPANSSALVALTTFRRVPNGAHRLLATTLDGGIDATTSPFAWPFGHGKWGSGRFANHRP
ncbi:hypothetical protein EJ110_NYTH55106 [Nymphaea thermarum]|nr:hypothetical protein EJ110_NYTH55106 [Nymphaea thermarum]